MTGPTAPPKSASVNGKSLTTSSRPSSAASAPTSSTKPPWPILARSFTLASKIGRLATGLAATPPDARGRGPQGQGTQRCPRTHRPQLRGQTSRCRRRQPISLSPKRMIPAHPILPPMGTINTTDGSDPIRKPGPVAQNTSAFLPATAHSQVIWRDLACLAWFQNSKKQDISGQNTTKSDKACQTL